MKSLVNKSEGQVEGGKGSTMSKTPTVHQFKQQLVEVVDELQTMIEELEIKQMKMQQILEEQKVSVDDVLSLIQSNETKINELGNQNAIKHKIETKLQNYRGGYSVIEKAKSNIEHLKRQQKKIYYIAAELNLPPISPEFKVADPINLINLHSFSDLANRKSKMRISEKNTIQKSYLEGLSLTETVNNQYFIGGQRCNSLIYEKQLLITINFNNSINNEKQYEILCLEETKLSELVKKFDCIVSELNLEYKDKKQKNECEYIIIGDHIYYKGKRDDIQQLCDMTSSFQKIHYSMTEMNMVKIGDLRVIFGHPYLYRHLKGCDHMLIFKQARIFRKNDQFQKDILQKKYYPLIIFQSKMRKKKCEACAAQHATLISICDKLKNGQNLYLCKNCHKDIHFNQKQEMHENCKVIPYIHD